MRDDAEVRLKLSPRRADTDRDGLRDGLERGLTRGIADPAGPVKGTDPRRFVRDRDPRTRTKPRIKDTDRDGLLDGREDRNHNGRRNRAETNPLKRDTDRDGVRDGRDHHPLNRRLSLSSDIGEPRIQMSETQLQTVPPRGDEIEAVARDISALARELAAETERRRQLPDELVARLRDSGLLRAGRRSRLTALELAPGPALRCAEEVARGDASAGWCVSIAITSSLLAAYLPAESRAELFGDGEGVAAGVWAPRGKARSVDGGVVVSGRWAVLQRDRRTPISCSPAA